MLCCVVVLCMHYDIDMLESPNPLPRSWIWFFKGQVDLVRYCHFWVPVVLCQGCRLLLDSRCGVLALNIRPVSKMVWNMVVSVARVVCQTRRWSAAAIAPETNRAVSIPLKRTSASWQPQWCCGYISRLCNGENLLGFPYMEVSTNGGTPKWMVYKGKSHWYGWWRGTPMT